MLLSVFLYSFLLISPRTSPVFSQRPSVYKSTDTTLSKNCQPIWGGDRRASPTPSSGTVWVGVAGARARSPVLGNSSGTGRRGGLRSAEGSALPAGQWGLRGPETRGVHRELLAALAPLHPGPSNMSPRGCSLSPLGTRRPQTFPRDLNSRAPCTERLPRQHPKVKLLTTDKPGDPRRGRGGEAGGGETGGGEAGGGGCRGRRATRSLPFRLDLRRLLLLDLHLSWLLSPPEPLPLPRTEAMAETQARSPEPPPSCTCTCLLPGRRRRRRCCEAWGCKPGSGSLFRTEQESALRPSLSLSQIVFCDLLPLGWEPRLRVRRELLPGPGGRGRARGARSAPSFPRALPAAPGSQRREATFAPLLVVWHQPLWSQSRRELVYLLPQRLIRSNHNRFRALTSAAAPAAPPPRSLQTQLPFGRWSSQDRRLEGGCSRGTRTRRGCVWERPGEPPGGTLPGRTRPPAAATRTAQLALLRKTQERVSPTNSF